MLETLETRRLFAFAVANGVLTVTGTPNPDHIAVGKNGSNLVIHQNGSTATTPAAGVTKIVINGLAGNDELRVLIGLNGVNLPATLNGGDGYDRLFGGVANDVLNGNLGNDILNGGPGNDVLNGNEGNDVLIGGPGADVFNGGSGNDTADYREARSNLVITLDNVANDGAPALAATATAPARPAENDNVKGDVENVIG
ncbi:MAG: serralysin, partial [Phycisphaerales bacterium]|nr:serralysin [Phycisphaerales bacterium]